MLNKRLQLLMDEKEYKRLKQIGRKTHKSVGEILREAARLYGEHVASRSERKEIIDKLFLLKLPVSSWNKMEREIVKSHCQ